VGYEEGGQLSERVDGAPTLLCCSMKLEKAHPDSASSCSRSGRGAKSPHALAQDRFPDHIIIMTIERIGAELIKAPTAMGLARSRPRILRGDADKSLDDSKRVFKPGIP